MRLQRTTQTFKQGSIATTDNTFDMAITGDGFFQVKSGTSTLYTRAGSFRTDTQGFVVDNSFQNVQGYQVQVSDPQMTTEIVDGLTLNGVGLINAAVSFDSNDPLTYNHATSIDIVDSIGLSHNVKSFFLLTVQGSVPPAAGNNTWQVYHQLDSGSTIIDGGTVSFNNATGAISTALSVPTLSFSTADLGTGADPMTITLDTAFLQQGTAFAITDLSANGSLRSREITPTIGNLQIDSSTMQPKITRMVDLGVNLNALEAAPIPSILLDHTVNLDGSLAAIVAAFDPADPATYHHSNLTQVYDSLGINHSLQTFFVKSAADDWNIYYTLDGQNQTTGGNITFAAATGAPTLMTVTTPITFTAAQLGSGATALSIVPDFNKVLQIRCV